MEPRLYSAAESRELDRIAIEEKGVPGFELMRRAGDAAFNVLLDRLSPLRSLTVFCGKGNNAGDGYLVAGRAHAVGIDVELLQLGSAASLTGDAELARDWAVSQGVVVRECEAEIPVPRGEAIVDALLGTGLSGAPRPPYDRAIELINSARVPVLAIDVPSGVNADTGAIAAMAVRADVTVTFIARKLGTFTGAGVAAAGEVVYADLGVSRDVLERFHAVPLLDLEAALTRYGLPHRDADAYKHKLGHVAVVGGDDAMGGAPLMAAEAALRLGAGMVTVISRAAHRPAMLARRPELMVADADDAVLTDEVLTRASTLIVGPGLGRASWGEQLLGKALALAKPAVIDADGLQLLARLGLELRGPTILTPHVAEAAALLGSSVADVQEDRCAAALALAQLAGGAGSGAAVLKGAGSVMAAVDAEGERLLGVCAHGNPGMASAGMGDVLAGVLGGLLAQRMSLAATTAVGVCAHSAAADAAAERVGERGLLATDLLEPLLDLTGHR